MKGDKKLRYCLSAYVCIVGILNSGGFMMI